MANIIIRFVKAGLDDTLINEAFEAIISIQEDRVWFDPDKCLLINERQKNVIYIFSNFEGKAFSHLMSLKNKIYGPSCILECIRKEQMLPKVSHPVFCMTLKGVIVSCTNLSGTIRDDIFKKVQWMNGDASKDLHEHVTHLVAGEVGSKKYIVAAKLDKVIVTPEWIDALWVDSQNREIDCKDPNYDKYKCPIFKGLQICISGLNLDERIKIKAIVEENGGKYSGEMKINECTHLILNTPTGDKYKFAIQWKVATVSPQWLYACLSAGYYVEESAFLIRQNSVMPNRCTTSTPTKDSRSEANLTGISNISALSVSNINETDLKLSRQLSSSILEPNIKLRSIKPQFEEFENFNLKNLPPTNNSLTSCKIFLCGLNESHLEKAKMIVSQGGGVRFNNLNETVTHIVVGKEKVLNAEKLVEFKLQSSAHVVNINWLLESYMMGRTANEFKYLIDVESLIDYSQEPTTINKPSKLKNDSNDCENDMKTLLSQYSSDNYEKLENDITLVHATKEELKHNVFVENDNVTKDKKFLTGKTFVVLAKESNINVEEPIKEYSGTILPLNTRQVADYAIVDICEKPLKITVNNIATLAWLQDCIYEEKILSISLKDIYSPIVFTASNNLLSGCVASVSGFSVTEKDVLNYILEKMGAKIQDSFVRKTDNQYSASTHLICAQPVGAKYDASVKWKIPAITKFWLFDCAKTGKKLPEEKYLYSNNDIYGCKKNDFSDTTDKINSTIAVPDNTITKFMEPKNPSSLKYTRIQALIDEERIKSSDKGTPKALPISEDSFTAANVSPSKFLYVNDFLPQFDLETMGDSPANLNKAASRHSLALDELYEQNIKIAINNANLYTLNNSTDFQDEVISTQQELKKPLDGVIISVAKKLSRNQSEYNKIAVSLGAEYRWTYDHECTHFIFQGRQNDTTKEFRAARDQGKIIVSPYWLFACEDKMARLDETQYPHTYNPNLSLNISASSQTPIRPTRSTQKKPLSTDSKTESTLEAAKHCNKVPNETNDKELNIVLLNNAAFINTENSTLTNKNNTNETSDNIVKNLNNKNTSPLKDTNNMKKSSVAIVVNVLDRSMVEKVEKINEFSSADNEDDQLIEACGNIEKEEENKHIALLSDLKRLNEASRSGKLSRNHSSFEKDCTDTYENQKLRLSRNESVEDDEKTKSIKKSTIKIIVETQPSQSVEVNWDDPAAREQIKILSSMSNNNIELMNRGQVNNEDKLAMLSSSTLNILLKDCDSTFGDSCKPNHIDDNTLPMQNKLLKTKSTLEQITNVTPKKNEKQFIKSVSTNLVIQKITPLDNKLGTIDNQNDKKLTEVNTPQKNQVKNILENKQDPMIEDLKPNTFNNMNNDDTILKCIELESAEKQKLVFMFSGISQNAREESSELIKRLGGISIDKSYYEAEATHLIIQIPTRNEKFLAFVSTGKWVLHISYLDECKKENRFIKEDAFEWGEIVKKQSPDTVLNSQQIKLAASASRWRQQLALSKKVGAFYNWRCMLLVDVRKEDGFRRLLEAGGAIVRQNIGQLDFNNITHLFLEPTKLKLQLEYRVLLQAGTHCIKPEYIASFLGDDPVPSITTFYVEEAMKIFIEEDSKKRKSAEDESNSKRIKR